MTHRQIVQLNHFVLIDPQIYWGLVFRKKIHTHPPNTHGEVLKDGKQKKGKKGKLSQDRLDRVRKEIKY
jgi:hypothetical protein